MSELEATRRAPLLTWAHGFFDRFKIVVDRFTDDHIVRVNFIWGDAGVIQRVVKSRIADDISGCTGHLVGDELCGRQSACIEMTFVHVQSHAMQTLLQLFGRTVGSIGEKEKLLSSRYNQSTNSFTPGRIVRRDRSRRPYRR